MGLDVYLYKIDDIEKKNRLLSLYDAKSDSTWSAAGEFSQLTEDQRKAIRGELETFALSLGLSKDGEYPGAEKVEIDSRLHPAHMFKIGYLRSSYNSAGLNKLMREKIGIDLGDIFSEDDAPDYEFSPDWRACRDRAIDALERWRALTAKTGKSYIVVETAYTTIRDWAKIDSPQAALSVFHQELSRYQSGDGPDFSSYSNGDGEFYMKEPLKVAAIIPGRGTFRTPCAYLIIEQSEETEQWYVQALEIVVEMCEYVLDQPDPEKYFLHWSS